MLLCRTTWSQKNDQNQDPQPLNSCLCCLWFFTNIMIALKWTHPAHVWVWYINNPLINQILDLEKWIDTKTSIKHGHFSLGATPWDRAFNSPTEPWDYLFITFNGWLSVPIKGRWNIVEVLKWSRPPLHVFAISSDFIHL